LKKRFLPGIDTTAERKRFAIFHACTLIISPLIAILAGLLINLTGSHGFRGSLFPFSDVRGEGVVIIHSVCVEHYRCHAIS